MLSRIRQFKEKGFTIIEVLIVLAIVGLIMLVVFLAVPALQRNARNTQRNADVASVLGAVNEFVNNNNGSLPTGASVDTATGALTITGTSGTNEITTKLGYYKNATTSVSISSSAPGSSGVNSTDLDTIVVYKAADCNAVGTMAIDGTTRSIAATYTLEADAEQCKSS